MKLKARQAAASSSLSDVDAPSAHRTLGVASPHLEGRSDRRAAIIGAAQRIFAQAGLAGARTGAIAAAAGVNKALLYYYFKSKDDLYRAVIEDHFDKFHRQAMDVLTAEGSARSILARYVALHFDFISARKEYIPLYQQLVMKGGKAFERFARKYFLPRSEAFQRLIERGMRDGELRVADPEHTAISIVGLIVFYFSCAPALRVLGRDDAYSPESLRRRKQEVLDFMRYAIFRNPEAPVE